MKKQVRVGIDVGGTFTDAVVIDNVTHEILAKAKIPTTHHAKRGVAEGIIQAIQKVLRENGIDAADVVFIAHGTTQATNALLEGDVARVGILGMGTGLEGERARKETTVGNLELAPDKYLYTDQVFINSAQLTDAAIDQAVLALKQKGAQVIVASEAYSVDDPAHEKQVVERAQQQGIEATGGYEISQLYGLLARTRTAAVNAALIPKMLETADMTEDSVKAAGIDKPLMIMRCDGGVMSIDEVRKRPILTMLSGLAAGVAGALMYEKITDGIFMEVGGTSIDISAIKDGKVMVKNSQVGGHKLYLTSLDVRTLGVAGGSMIVIRDGAIADVGPRSAHIADLEYEVFADPTKMQGPKMILVAPCAGDTADYAAVQCADNSRYALTLAGAANVLGYVPQGDYAQGNAEVARLAWGAVSEKLNLTVEQACRRAMDLAAAKIQAVVESLIADYKLNRNLICLVGGGGSAGVVAPYLGEKMGIRSRIAQNAPYISTIGVAMAMVMERLERNVMHPTPEDIRQLRSDILEQITKAGANPETVDIAVEIDSQKNILRAVATGATELRTKDLNQAPKSEAELLLLAKESAGAAAREARLVAATGNWHAYAVTTERKALFGLFKTHKEVIRIIDGEGVIRLQKEQARAIAVPKSRLMRELEQLIDEYTIYNDAGSMPPKVFLYYRQKASDFSGVANKEQLMPLIALELEHIAEEEMILAVAARE
ncbi:MAG: hydantoinase/oxoprolinase family protein [Gemmiger sp.]|nr:hydantoinase/oxoprolinase family protein [Gemmiger sp.]